MRIHPFEPSSRSKFIIFQGEHKGPKNEILISGAPKSLVPGFHATCVNCAQYLVGNMDNENFPFITLVPMSLGNVVKNKTFLERRRVMH